MTALTRAGANDSSGEITILKFGRIFRDGPVKMSITVNMKPDAEAELSRQAAAHGVQPEEYAAGLLEEAVHTGAAAKTLSTNQLDRTIQELAQFSHKIPLLPDEAFTRESLYQDHD